MQRRLTWAIALLLILPCMAQDTPQLNKPPKKPKPPAGSISGTVYCGDTNLPARGASIYLLQIAAGSQSSRMGSITDLEGRFVIPHVREGSYFVMAQLPGYLNPISDLTQSRLQDMTADERKALESRMALAIVSANQPADVSLRLERAAEIDGTVQYDDGSPAIGLSVILKPKAGPSDKPFDSPAFPAALFADRLQRLTDDRGHFRILGVAPGDYLVGVSVPTRSSDSVSVNPFVQAIQIADVGTLSVYAGNTTRASTAKIIKIESSDASKDVDITIPLSRLYTIRGHVVLKSTNQAPLAATVELVYADTGEVARMAIAPNGKFDIHYVSEDSYRLQATASPRPLPIFEVDDDDQGMEGAAIGMSSSFLLTSSVGKPDNSTETLLTVTGDVDNVVIAVPDPPKSGPQPEPDSTDVEQPAVSSPQ